MNFNDLQALQHGIQDLVTLTTLPAKWYGHQPQEIAIGLSELLINSLHVDLVYIGLTNLPGMMPLEVVRTGQRLLTGDEAQAVGKSLNLWQNANHADSTPSVPHPLGDGLLQIAVNPIGMEGVNGYVLVGKDSAESFSEIELLLLRVAVNQAATALQQAQLLADVRAADQLKETLLAKEQAARNQAAAAQKRMHFLEDASATLSAVLDYETALEQLCRLAVPTIADSCEILLYGDDGQVRVVNNACGHTAHHDILSWIQNKVIFGPGGASAIANVLRTGKSLLISDFDESSLESYAENDEHRGLLRQLDLQSVIVVALQTRDHVLGAIIFSMSESGRHYDADDLILAEELAKRVAAAVDQARLYEAQQQIRETLQNRIRLQSSIAELGQEALVSFDVPTLMDHAAGILAQALDIEFAKILEYLPDQGSFLLRAGIGWRDGLVGHEIVGGGLESQAGYALVSHIPVIVEDLRSETRFHGESLLLSHRVVSGISVLIEGYGQPWGILGVHTAQRRKFTADDIYFVQSVANILGAALERARWYKAEHLAREALQNRVRLQSQIADLGQEALVSFDLPTLMDHAATVLSQALDIEFAKILEYIPDEDNFLLRAGIGWREGLVGRETVSGGLESQGGYAMMSHTPVIVEDLRTETRFHGPSLLLSHGVVSGISVLIEGYGQPWGILGVHTAKRRTFTADDIYFVQSVANILGAALERARWFAQAQETATIQERQRIARELHDAVTQTLFSASLMAETLPTVWERQPQKGLQQTRLLHELTRSAAAEMRVLLVELRPESIVSAKLGDLLTQLGYGMQGRRSIEVSTLVRGDSDQPLPPEVQVAIYRIAQESLNNIIKHGGAKKARIKYTRTKTQVRLVITDNGQGFDPRAPSTGIGLMSMQERAKAVGASLKISSKIGVGTCIRLTWDIP